MGYDNGLAVAAVKVKIQDERGRESTVVALFTQVADSNVYVDGGEHNNQMSRSWSLLKPEEEWRVMQSVVQISASCEGGMLKWKGKDAKAETFIAACRKAVESAPYVTDLRQLGERQIGQHCLELPISVKDLDSYGKERYEELLLTDIPHKEKYGDTMVFEFSPDAKGLAEYTEWSSLGGRNCWGTSPGVWEFDAQKFDNWAKPLRAPVYAKPKLEKGTIVDLSDGCKYTLGGESFDRFEIVSSSGANCGAKGIRADGTRTEDVYSLKGLGKYVKPTLDGIPTLAADVQPDVVASLFNKEKNDDDCSNQFKR
jgi:hypothetical protein